MSLVDLVSEVESLLPPKVHKVLVELAQEVDKHKALLQETASLGGPVAETVATGVEDVSSAVESTENATAAPSTTSTDGGSQEAKAEDPQASSGVESSLPGNYEQSLPYEQWPKAE